MKIAKHVDAFILSPFNPKRFLKEVNKLINKGINKHIAEIHQQHIDLARRINQLIDITEYSTDVVEKIEKLMIIKQLAFEHFDFEESYMRNHNYADYLVHFQNHEVMRNSIRFLLKDPKERINKDELKKFYSEMFDDLKDDEQYIRFLDQIKMSEVE